MKQYEFRIDGQEWTPMVDDGGDVHRGVIILLETSLCTEVRLTLETSTSKLHITYREVPEYRALSARQAKASNYGDKSYWDYLEEHAHELHGYFLVRGDKETAELMFTQSLGEALMGNDGD